MIKSEIIKIKKTENFNNSYIEQELSKLYKSVIRWAIVDVSDDISVSVSYATITKNAYQRRKAYR